MHARLVRLIAAAAVALPLAAATTTPAQAVGRFQLTVRIVDRAGHPAGATAQVINTSSDTSILMGTGSHRRLGAGTYNVAAWILSGPASNPTYTLADQVVDLNRNRTIVLDARQGRRVRLSLDNPAAQAETLQIAPIVNNQWAFDPTTVVPPVGSTFMVPMRSPLMRLYVYSVWEQKGNTLAHPSPFRYDIVSVFRGGIPAGPLIRTRTAQLARVDVTVRAVDANEQATLTLSPFSPFGGAISPPLNAGTTLGATPARLVSYRTPGYEWQPLLEWDAASTQQLVLRDNDLNQPVYGHRRYSELWGAAVWSPAPGALFGQLDARQLSAGLIGSDFPVGDALHPTDEGTAKTAIKLFSGGRLLAHGGQVSVRIPAVTRTYTLTLSTTRPAGTLLSTQISGVWKFLARGSSRDVSVPVQVYGLQLLPAGLDLRNRAGGGSTTRIALRIFSGLTANVVLVPTVRAWASANDGKTWQRVSVRRLNGHYVISVRNASAAGFTSLRVYLADRHGSSEDLTVIHAYGVR